MAAARSTSNTSRPVGPSRRGTTVAPGMGVGGWVGIRATVAPHVTGSGGLVHELLDVDDDAGDLAGGDEPPVVGRRDREGEATALDLVEPGLGADAAAHAGGRQVVELDPHADRRVTLRDLTLDREDRGL